MATPSKPTVVIAETLDADSGRWLADRATVVWCGRDADRLSAALPEAHGLVVRSYTRVDEPLLATAPLLRVVGRGGVGLEQIDLDACRKRGVEVVYTPDANTQAVVEYVLGLLLDRFRPRVSFDGPVAENAFHDLRAEHVGTQLDGLTLGILGFGRVGRRLGAVASVLGMKLLVNDIRPEAPLRGMADYPFEFVDKEQLYRGCDVLSIHVDGRPTNRHLIDAAALKRLKPDCFLINTARGGVVDAEALACWASERADSGAKAVLDVHDPEPPVEDYPLYKRSNVRLLPHLASRTTRALANMSWVVRDVMAVLEGRSPQFPAP